MTLPVTSRWYAHAGSSSGLHHDYHDNLYCLLRGRKRFRIFPPALVRQMHTHGEICMIHPNGRIVYKGQVRSCWQCLMAQHVPLDSVATVQQQPVQQRPSSPEDLWI